MNFVDLEGSRVLVLEDDQIRALEMAAALEAQGSEVVGPVPLS